VIFLVVGRRRTRRRRRRRRMRSRRKLDVERVVLL
jgi:hypothetical protein